VGRVSIPSRGFWFFENGYKLVAYKASAFTFQSPRGDFGFLKYEPVFVFEFEVDEFQSPRGDFGFLK